MKNIVVDWSSRNESDSIISILKFIDSNEKIIRDKYLRFLYDLENEKVSQHSLIDIADKKGYNLWIISQIYEKNFYKSSLNIDFLKILALEEILLNNYKSIEVLNAPQRFFVSIKQICEINRVSCRFINSSKVNIINLKIPKLFSGIFFLIISYIRSLEAQIFSENKYSFKQNSKISIFSYFYNFKIDENFEKVYFNQWYNLPEKIESIYKQKINWFHHFIRHKKINKISKIIKITNKLNKKENQDLHYLIISNFGFFMFIKLFFVFIYNSLFGKYKNFREILFIQNKHRKVYWDLFKNDWNESFHGKVLMQNLIWIEIYEKILNRLPKQDLGFYLYENQSWERIMIHAWKRNGHGKIIGFTPNITRYWDLRFSVHSDIRSLKYILPDKIICVNQITHKSLLDMGFHKDNIIKEYLPLDYNNKNNYHEIIAATKQSDKNIILFGDYDKNINYDFLNILQNIKNINQYKFMLKCHPANKINIEGFEKLRLEIIDDEIDNLKKFKNAIVIGATGVSLELYIKHFNLVIFHNENDLNYSSLKDVNGVKFAYNKETLENYLLNIHSEGTDKKQEKLFFQSNDQDNWNLN